ncbi:MAG TPA: aminotransferase class I/II-fold pyridoxal phosphate-dependent enzyme [Acidobacteriota bacterium]|nr:aminotransferase class I/II-fold pyridoxal phosphate-dependent enzyme [Acidobacteriota bacterium]
MSVSRRSFVKKVGIGSAAAAVMAYDGPRSIARAWSLSLPQEGRPLLLHYNENPLGPGAKALDAMEIGITAGNHPTARYGLSRTALVDAITATQGVPQANLIIGNGSTQILRTATHVFTSPSKHLVTGAPSYGECSGYAELIGTPVEFVPVGASMQLDLDAMADAAKGAGLVFLDNPNNPTATLHDADAIGAFVDRVMTETEAVILIDEAYHDYVTDPAYRSEAKRAVGNKRILVARTFSKAHGMAGMRIGYGVGHTDTLAAMNQWQYNGALNVAAIAGAAASLLDTEHTAAEQARNTEVRRFTVDWFKSRGIRATDTQTNFVFVNLGVPAAEFRGDCAEHGVKVGRDFRPFHDVWSRISLGTMEEMHRATEVFGQVLGLKKVAAA